MEEQTYGWRWLTVVMVVVTVGGVVLIGSGALDPKPIGPRRRAHMLEPQRVAPASRRLVWLEEPIPAGDFSLRLTAALDSGELDSAYGLALGREEDYLAVAVSPAGYLSILQEAAATSGSQAVLPWQTWPHVGTETAVNEIWLDVVGGQLTVWVNREKLWMGAMPRLGGEVGLFLESYGGTAVVAFQTLELYLPDAAGVHRSGLADSRRRWRAAQTMIVTTRR